MKIHYDTVSGVVLVLKVGHETKLLLVSARSASVKQPYVMCCILMRGDEAEKAKVTSVTRVSICIMYKRFYSFEFRLL